MPLISGKRAFLELLRQEGVEVIFGNPGTTELPLMDALAVESLPRYVLGLQEGAVMAMAGGYAQASGRLTAVNIHVAPGLGNAMGMLYDAQKAGAPILVTAGQHDQSFSLTEPILWAELPEIARPFVKWAVEVRRLADLPRLLHRAAKTALAPPTGPVGGASAVLAARCTSRGRSARRCTSDDHFTNGRAMVGRSAHRIGSVAVKLCSCCPAVTRMGEDAFCAS